MPPCPSPSSYLRCLHCKGFYEIAFSRCKWCKYGTPLLDADGTPRVFPDRETCRAIQIAEWEQLPDDIKNDGMGPPLDEPALRCNCLHCGPDGHTFEAIEMRWLENEQMWACPCTTCGGRGFSFDIHSAEQKWQCCECGHFYTPPNRDFRAENANCPRCGCKRANGWFDDGYQDEDDTDELDQQLKRELDAEFEDDFEDEDDDPHDHEFGGGRAGRDSPALSAKDKLKSEFGPKRGTQPFLDDSLPWDDDVEDESAFDLDSEDEDDEGPQYDLGITWKEADDDRSFSSFDPDEPIPFANDFSQERIPDDIDHPRFFRTRDDKDFTDLNEDDIPF